MSIIRNPNNPMYDAVSQSKLLAQIEANKVAGYVYLLQPVGVNIYKIGCTTDLDNRMKRYKSKYKFPVQYVGAIRYKDYFQAEREWHSMYTKYNLVGEWFVLPEPEVLYFVSMGAQS